MDLSNKTLGLLLVAAIVISIGGTIISLNKLDGVSTTGYATNNETGTVTLTVPEALSIVLNDSDIDFGTCTLNTTRGYNFVDSLRSGTTYNNAECTLPNGFPDYIIIRNDGNVNANVSLRTNTNGSTLFNDGGSSMAYQIDNGTSPGCAGGAVMQDSYLNFTVVGASNDYVVCSNLTTSASAGTDVNLTIQAYLTNLATTGGSMTLTFEARNT